MEPDADWMEIDNGPEAGLPYDEARAKFPPPEFRTPYQPHVWSIREGESLWDLRARAVRGIQKVVMRGPGQYLVVAHGGVLNEALRSIVGAPPPAETQGLVFRFGDGGFARFTYTAETHTWMLTEFK